MKRIKQNETDLERARRELAAVESDLETHELQYKPLVSHHHLTSEVMDKAVLKWFYSLAKLQDRVKELRVELRRPQTHPVNDAEESDDVEAV